MTRLQAQPRAGHWQWPDLGLIQGPKRPGGRAPAQPGSVLMYATHALTKGTLHCKLVPQKHPSPPRAQRLPSPRVHHGKGTEGQAVFCDFEDFFRVRKQHFKFESLSESSLT